MTATGRRRSTSTSPRSTAPARWGPAPPPAGGHALVVTDVTATHENGTSVTAIRGAGVAELVASPTRPSGQSVVEIGLEPAPDGTEYDYWLVAERVERSG